MYFTVDKARRYIRDLRSYVYDDQVEIPRFKVCEEDVPQAFKPEFDDSAWSDFKIGSEWGGRDRTAWFRTTVDVPEHWVGKKIALYLIVGAGREGGLGGSEALLYVNGKAVQGLDAHHREACLLPEHIESGRLSIAIKAFSGLQDEKRVFRTARLVRIHEDAEDFFFRASTVLMAIETLPESDYDRQNLVRFLNEAINTLDFRKPGSEQFYSSVARANDLLKARLLAYKPASENKPIITAVGHSHIDVAWLWQLKHTREKCSRTFSTVNHLMKQYPEYVFLQSTPQLYEYIEEDYPEIFAEIKKNIEAGRWEVTGGMWVEADCNVPSGESLVRQFLFGTRYMKERFGVECTVLWLPDVFGYSWALPQIIKKSGLKYFMTTKISWSQYNRSEYDTFMWRGLDGTEVLTHFITTTEGETPRFFTYNGKLTPASAKYIWEHYRQKDINSELLLAYGWGDGGGGPTKEMIETGLRMQELPRVPEVHFGKAEDYFDRLAATVQGNPKLPVVDGELYLEYHRGTYTSQARTKRNNRKSEILLHNAELFNSLAFRCLDGYEYPQKEINESWKIVLRNQFHDILPGSSIHEVYIDSEKEFAQVFESGTAQLQRSLQALADSVSLKGRRIVVFNPLSWSRGGAVRVPWADEFSKMAVVDESGSRLITRVVDGKCGKFLEIDVPSVPGLGYRTFPLVAASDAVEPLASPEHESDRVTVGDRCVENRFFRIEFNRFGQIVSIYDKELNREVIPPGQAANVFQAFEDRPMQFDAWDIDLYYQEKETVVKDLVGWEVEECSPEQAVILFKWKFLDSTIEQRMVVRRDSRRIDFRTKVDWREHSILLKVAFPVDVRATKATYEIQFGNVERPTHWNTSWDYAKFETVGHKWADLSERDYGVSLLNDCKYGYDIKNNVMRLTLIKSGIEPDPMADQGEHLFTYSIYPHAGDWFEGETAKQGYELNYELLAALADGPGGGLPTQGAFATVNAASTVLETVKKSEDDDSTVLRFYEYGNCRDDVVVEFPRRVKEAVECNLMEKPVEKAELSGDRLTFQIKPYEIKTFKVKFE
ncbi:MAG: alpha-mannosidase [Bacillota bacterium]